MSCLEIARSMECYESIAFLDDGCVGETICDCPVIGKIEDIEKMRDKYDTAFVALGDNQKRCDLLDKMKSQVLKIATLISQRVNVSKYR